MSSILHKTSWVPTWADHGPAEEDEGRPVQPVVVVPIDSWAPMTAVDTPLVEAEGRPGLVRATSLMALEMEAVASVRHPWHPLGLPPKTGPTA
jgi:hypothetical protein